MSPQPDSTAIVVAQEHPSFPVVATALEKRLPSIQAFLGGNAQAADRFRRVVLQSLVRNPDLLNASVDSITSAAAEAAQLGLEPSGAVGGAHLVRYGDKAQLLIDYRGLVELARRSEQIEDVFADVVREKDHFEARRGLRPDLVHEPDYSADRGPSPDVDGNRVIHAYAVALFKSGHRRFDVMSRAEIEAIRARSRAGNKGPWVSDWSEMAKKTVMRRLCKTLPLHAQAREVIAADEEREYGSRIDAEPAAPATGSLVERLRARRAPMGAEGSIQQPEEQDQAGDGEGSRQPPATQPGQASVSQERGSPAEAHPAPSVPEAEATSQDPAEPESAHSVREPSPPPEDEPAAAPSPPGGGSPADSAGSSEGSTRARRRSAQPAPAAARATFARTEFGFEPEALHIAVAVVFEGLQLDDLSDDEWDAFCVMARDYKVVPPLGTAAYRALPVQRKSKIRAVIERRSADQAKTDAQLALAQAAHGGSTAEEES